MLLLNKILLIYFVIVNAVSSGTDSQCFNIWAIEPDPMQSDKNCNYLDGRTMLKLTCAVRRTSDQATTSVQWLHTSSSENAGRNGSNISEEYINGNGSTEEVVGAILQLPNEKIKVGYYWCKIETPRAVQLNPSTIVNISSPCFTDACPSNPLVIASTTSTMRCANGEIAENLSFVNLQGNTVCTGETTTTGGSGDDEDNSMKISITEQSSQATASSTTSAAVSTSTIATDAEGSSMVTGLALLVLVIVILLLIIAILIAVLVIVFRRRCKGDGITMTQNQLSGVITADMTNTNAEDTSRAEDDMRMTQNQVYGLCRTEDMMEMTQNQVYRLR